VKGTFKALAVATTIAVLAGCSTVKEYQEQTTLVKPKWYDSCEQKDSEGFFWWKEEFLIGCGTSIDSFETHAYGNAVLNAKAQVADRITGFVSEQAHLEYNNDSKDTRLKRLSEVLRTNLRGYEVSETYTYPYRGKFVSYVKIRVPVEQVHETSTNLPN